MAGKPKLTTLERDGLFSLMGAAVDASFECGKAWHGPFVADAISKADKAETDALTALDRWVRDHFDIDTGSEGSA